MFIFISRSLSMSVCAFMPIKMLCGKDAEEEEEEGKMERKAID